MGNSYFWAGPLLAPILVIGIVKLGGYLGRKIPEGKWKRLLTKERGQRRGARTGERERGVVRRGAEGVSRGRTY